MIIFEADDPLVLNGTYDQEGFTPAERRAQQRKAAAAARGPEWYRDGVGIPRCNVCLCTSPCQCGFVFTGEVTLMAKKKAGRKKPAGKRKVKARGKRRSPSAQTLPGLEQVRSVKLDRLCESIGDGREQMNKLRTEEKDDNRQALRIMHDEDRTVYRHAGVELVRVPGEEKLRVRTTGEDASDLTVEDKPADKPNADAAEPQTADGE